MSKISLTPNASGTGTFSIASPNSNTNRTITLPDEAGELLVNTSTGIDVTGTVLADGLTVDGNILDNGGFKVKGYYSNNTGDGYNVNLGVTGNIGYLQSLNGTALNPLSLDGSTFSVRTGSYSTAMTIDASGNVGIGGTPDSGRKLHIEGGDATVGITLKDTAGSQFGINSDGGALIFKSDSSGEERMSISSNGHVKFSDGNLAGYSQTSGRGGSAIYADTGASGGTIIQTNNANNGWSSVYLNKFDWAAGKDGRLIQFTVNGSGAAGGVSIASASTITYNTSSDYRLKENVVYEWDATTRLKQLKPARFNFILDGTDTPQDGFMAHEAQEVVPLSVSGTKDAMKDEEYEVTPAVIDENGTETTPAVMGTRSVIDPQSIDHSMLVPLLVKTIQELEARIAALEAV